MSDAVSYVKATNLDDCIVACLAMITNKSFTEVNLTDVHLDNWVAYLSAHGYAIQDVQHDYTPEHRLVSPWPVKPFAPIHIMFVHDIGNRPVIMLQDGVILDPMNIQNHTRHKYHRIYRFVGIWKVGDALEFIKPTTPASTILKVIPPESTI